MYLTIIIKKTLFFNKAYIYMLINQFYYSRTIKSDTYYVSIYICILLKHPIYFTGTCSAHRDVWNQKLAESERPRTSIFWHRAFDMYLIITNLHKYENVCTCNNADSFSHSTFLRSFVILRVIASTKLHINIFFLPLRCPDASQPTHHSCDKRATRPLSWIFRQRCGDSFWKIVDITFAETCFYIIFALKLQ